MGVTETEERMDIGTRIREHREAVGLSQAKLADTCFVSRQTLSNWERNKTLPDIESLRRMAATFETTVDALIGDDTPEIVERIDEDRTELTHILRTRIIIVAVYLAWVIWNYLTPKQDEAILLTGPLVMLGFGYSIGLGRCEAIIAKRRGLNAAQLAEILEFVARDETGACTISARTLRLIARYSNALVFVTLALIYLTLIAFSDSFTAGHAILGIVAFALAYICTRHGPAIMRKLRE